MKPLKALINKSNINSATVSKIHASQISLSDLEEGNILLSIHGYHYVVAPEKIVRKYLQIKSKLETSNELVFVRQYGWQSFENYLNFPKCDDEEFNIEYVYPYTSKFETVRDLEQYFKNIVVKVD